jgi:hypothetical protein
LPRRVSVAGQLVAWAAATIPLRRLTLTQTIRAPLLVADITNQHRRERAYFSVGP